MAKLHHLKKNLTFDLSFHYLLQVYLADYGLSYRYCPNGEHKDYKENPKKGHNGTIEYTSTDAHRGVGKADIFIHFNLLISDCCSLLSVHICGGLRYHQS